LATFHGARLSSLGDPLVDAERWLAFIRDWPYQFRTLVSLLWVTSMPLDIIVKPTTIVDLPAGAFRCECGYAAATKFALDTHCRAKHGAVMKAVALIGSSCICLVCLTWFSNRGRLLAHVADRRVRSSKVLACHTVFELGLVQPPPEAEVRSAADAQRQLQRTAHKRGHSRILASAPVSKKTRGSIVPEFTLEGGAARYVQPRPDNAVDWHEVVPSGRLTKKTALDEVLARTAKRHRML